MNPTNSMMRSRTISLRIGFRLLKATALVAVALAAASCAFSRLKTDVEYGSNQLILKGTVNAKSNTVKNLVIVVYTPYEEAQRIAAFQQIDPALNKFVFALDPGEYRLAIFEDKNKNITIDRDEPVLLANRGKRLKFSEVVKMIEVKLDVPKDQGLPKGYPGELASLPDSIHQSFHRAVGDIANLDKEAFSSKTGKLGLWEPTRFLKEFGAGIYMLGPYDPNKTPVIFVNGAGGSPQNWRWFFDHLDNTKYQAWFLLYPSGMRIKRLGKGFNELIRDMHAKFGFKECVIVAHSMGGLVSRDALVEHLQDGKPPLVKTFITISTPWNGHRMAKKGVKALSTPVPSWHDVVPGSEFLQTVFDFPLRGKIAHHLLFGYIEGTEEDGSVDLNSVLLSEAQDDAVELRAFEADHLSILSMEPVLEYVEAILADELPTRAPAAQPCAATPPQTEGTAAAPTEAPAPSMPAPSPLSPDT